MIRTSCESMYTNGYRSAKRVEILTNDFYLPMNQFHQQMEEKLTENESQLDKFAQD